MRSTPLNRATLLGALSIAIAGDPVLFQQFDLGPPRSEPAVPRYGGAKSSHKQNARRAKKGKR